MAEINEPRALTSALSGPVFNTRGVGMAMHVADRHVERWAPESGANRMRPMRSLGFVDRMIAPWIETAQRSASMRLFSQYAGNGFSERTGGDVSWVFPRPWYQDELDWMAAARKAGPTGTGTQAPSMFTTRGTYVAPVQQQRPAPAALPTALYEYVAPSLSVAQPAAPAGVGYGGDSRDAYSPLVSLAAVQAAEVMSRVVAPTMSAPGRMSPALRSVLSTMLERAAAPRAIEPIATRLSMQAPELVTPPAPRPEPRPGISAEPATQVAVQYAEQRAKIAEVQRIARVAAERELVARSEALRVESESARTSTAPSPVATAEVRVAAQRAEAELRQRLAAAKTDEQRKQIETEQAAATERASTERARIEQRIAQRMTERGVSQRLHDQARADAAAHVRTPIEPAQPVAPIAERRAPAEVTAALAALPPGLANFIGSRPDRAMQRIDELNEAFRAVELMARGAAQGATFEVTRGPRLTMPVGLGGLVSAIDRAQSVSDRSGQRVPTIEGFAATYAAQAGQPATGQPAPSTLAAMRSPMRVPSLPFLTSPSFAPRTYAPIASAPSGMRSMAPNTALGATASSTPNALSHVAWADRWLARFAGASQHSLDTLTATGSSSMSRMQALAEAAPGAVFVSPMFDARKDGEQIRVDSAGRVIVTQGAKPSVSSLVTPTPAPVLSSAQLAELSALVATLPATSSSITSAISSGSPEAIRAAMSAAATGAEMAPEAMLPESRMPEAVRIADDAETSDDVFAEIAAAATRSRTSRARAAQPVAAPTPAAAMPAMAFERGTLADTIAHASPSSPGAGFAAQLASSPFAPALRHVLPMPSSMPFDVRALFGGGLSASYLAGLLAPASHELEIGAHAVPTWASWSFDDRAIASPLAERFAPEWDATYVSPDAPVDLTSEHIGGQPMTEQQAAQGAPLTTLRSALLSFGLPYDIETGSTVSTAAMHPAGSAETFARELATSSFLYPNAAPTGATGSAASAAMSPTAARSMIEAMSLPMLGDATRDEDPASSWTQPGMIAERAHSYSVAQERTSSDLALDFVSPELVLAARVYGLGPVEAAQAARLALAGPGHLTAMAGTVDRTFVQAMAMEAERRERLVSPRTAYPTAAGETAIIGDFTRRAPSMAWVAPDAGGRADAGRDPELEAAAGYLAPSAGSSFGVDRRAPRGAFLWPSATISALGLNAAAPDGQQSMSVAALELLAAQAVAELGTFAALSDDRPADVEAGSATSLAARGEPAMGADLASEATVGTESARARGSRDLVGVGALGAQLGAEPSEADVLGTAAALIPSARRARFEALYVALSQSPSGSTWSPAARAARALALVGRGEAAGLSARERAMTAWDVLPVVYAAAAGSEVSLADLTGTNTDDSSMAAAGRAASMTYVAGRASTGAAASRRTPGSAPSVDDFVGTESFDESQIIDRPGLGALSARAGEALGSYVAPQAYSDTSASVSSSSAPVRDPYQVGAVLRAPTIAPEFVQTGRPTARHGGGEQEIPAWFETAARKMFEQQGNLSSAADGISLSELTLISSTPSNQIAASTRGVPTASAPISPASGTTKQGDAKTPQIDVEKLANEIYRHILVMMDAARARNGEPYL
jgi:hypothetical protein